jgi:DNA-binding response OmpR family regulator
MTLVGEADLNRRVLIIGIEEDARHSWSELLVEWNFDVREASSRVEALRLIRKADLAAIVCVWPMPDSHQGLDLLSTARRHDDRVAIAVVEFAGGITTMCDVLGSGADYCWRRSFDSKSLAAHLYADMRRGQAVLDSTIRAGDVTVNVAGHQAWRGKLNLSLTPTEFLMLVSFVKHSGEVVSKSMLLAECWRRHDDPHHDMDHVIEVHVGELRRKLHAAGDPILRTVYSLGYILRPIEG